MSVECDGRHQQDAAAGTRRVADVHGRTTTMHSAFEIRERVADARRSGRTVAAVEELLALLDGRAPRAPLLSALAALGRDDSTAARRAVAGLTEHVQRRRDPPAADYDETAIETVLALVREHPGTAGRAQALFTDDVVWRISERALTRTLAHLAPAVPGFVLDLAETVATVDDGRVECQWTLDWAFVRAARANPDAVTVRVASLAETVREGGPEAHEAIAALGLLGRAIPDRVAPAVPALVDRLGDGTEGPRQRAAAAEALGLVGGRYRTFDARAGVAAPDLVADAVGPLVEAVRDADAAVAEAAAEALGRVGHEDPTLLAPHLESLAVALPAADAGVQRAAFEALASALEGADAAVVRGTGLPAAAVECYRAGGETVRRAVVAALGAMGWAALDAEPAVRETFVDALGEAGTAVQSRAATALEPVLAAAGDEELLAALGAALTGDPEWNADELASALVASGRTGEAVVDPLRGYLAHGSHPDDVAGAVAALGDAGVAERGVATLVERLAGIDSHPDEHAAVVDDAPHAAVLSALRTLADVAPAAVGGELDAVVALLGTEDFDTRREAAAVVAAVADEAPGAVEPHADALVRAVGGSGRATVHLLTALAAVDRCDAALLREHVAGLHPRDAAAEAVADLAGDDPAVVLPAAARMVASQRLETGDELVHRAVTGLGRLAAADGRYRPLALDALGGALADPDDWVRWDAAEGLAAVAAVDPESIRRLRDDLAGQLPHTNPRVVRYAAEALAALEDGLAPATRGDLRSYPGDQIRDVVAAPAEASGGDGTGGDGTGDDRGVTALVDRVRAAGKADGDPAAWSATGEAGATRGFAVRLEGLRHPDADVREAAADALRTAAGGTSTGHGPLPAAFLDAPSPVRRALAAYALGGVAAEAGADGAKAAVDGLGPLLSDDVHHVRLWALLGLARVADARPVALEGALSELAGLLSDGDEWTRRVAVEAVRCTAEGAPGVVAGADALGALADGLGRRLGAEAARERREALDALQFLPPAAVAADTGRVASVVESLDDDGVRVPEAAARVVASVAAESPDALVPHVDALVEHGAGVAPVQAALAAVAEVAPEKVRAHGEAFADLESSPTLRRLLVRCRSGEYTDALDGLVRADAGGLDDERALFVEYVRHADAGDRVSAIDAACAHASADVLGRVLSALVDGPGGSEHARQRSAEAVTKVVDRRADALEHVDRGRLVDALLSLATDDGWEVRSAAFEALATVLDAAGVPEGRVAAVVEHALDALGDSEGWVRRHAADALAALPAAELDRAGVVDLLVDALGTGSPFRRRGVVRALDALAPHVDEPAAVVDALGRRLADDDPWVRRNALDATGTLAAEAWGWQTPPLPPERRSAIRDGVRDLTAHSNPSLRVAACRCLGTIGSAADRSLLRDRKRDFHGAVRQTAAEALARLDRRLTIREAVSDGGVAALAALVDARDALVREWALDALGACYADRAASDLYVPRPDEGEGADDAA